MITPIEGAAIAGTAAVVGYTAATIMAVNFQDIYWAMARRQLCKTPHAKRFRHRPQISVVLYGDNNESTVTACLDSLRDSRYKKLQVIFVDDASNDSSLDVVRSYRKIVPRLTIQTIRNRVKPRGSFYSWQRGRSQASGELLFFMRADERITPGSFHTAIEFMALGADAVRFSRENRPTDTLGSLVELVDGILANNNAVAWPSRLSKQPPQSGLMTHGANAKDASGAVIQLRGAVLKHNNNSDWHSLTKEFMSHYVQYFQYNLNGQTDSSRQRAHKVHGWLKASWSSLRAILMPFLMIAVPAVAAVDSGLFFVIWLSLIVLFMFAQATQAGSILAIAQWLMRSPIILPLLFLGFVLRLGTGLVAVLTYRPIRTN